jgi:hypothetical protein
MNARSDEAVQTKILSPEFPGSSGDGVSRQHVTIHNWCCKLDGCACRIHMHQLMIAQKPTIQACSCKGPGLDIASAAADRPNSIPPQTITNHKF